MGVRNQVIGTFILCGLCLIMGVMFTWPSSTLTIFSSANTTLDRTMTEGEIALLGSLSSVGAMVSTPITGMFLDRLGRKKSSIITCLTAVIGWAMISVSNRVEVVLTAIFVSGLSGCSFIICTVYITEICQESIRGTMSSIMMVFYGIGMLLQYVMGGLMEYWMMVYSNLTMAVLGSLGIFFLKESPVFLMSQGFDQEAAKAIAFFRNEKPDSKEVLNEIENIRRSLNPDIDDDETSEEEHLKPITEKKQKEKLSLWQFVRKSRATRKAVLITVFLMTSSIFQGLPVVQVYADPLFSEAIPSISSTLCAILFAVVTVVAGFIAAYMTDAVGRKPLIVYASIASGFCSLLLGSQVHLSWGPHWVTAVIIYSFCVAYTFGAGTVPYVLTAELFLPEVKSYITMMVVEWTWLCNFLILLVFNPLVSVMGLGPVFYIFSIFCFLTAIFSFFFVPETKGLPLDAIQDLLSPRRRRNLQA